MESDYPVKLKADNGWKLVWNEEFDGPEIDLSKWNYDIGGHGYQDLSA